MENIYNMLRKSWEILALLSACKLKFSLMESLRKARPGGGGGPVSNAPLDLASCNQGVTYAISRQLSRKCILSGQNQITKTYNFVYSSA